MQEYKNPGHQGEGGREKQRRETEKGGGRERREGRQGSRRDRVTGERKKHQKIASAFTFAHPHLP